MAITLPTTAPETPAIVPAFRLGRSEVSFDTTPVFGDNPWNEPDPHDVAMQQWRADTFKAVETMAMEPDKAFAGVDFSYAPDPIAEQRRLTVDSFIEANAGEFDPFPQDNLQRHMARVSLAERFFNGRGADSDDALFAEIKGATQMERDGQALRKEVQSRAIVDAITAAPKMTEGKITRGDVTWQELRAEIAGKPGYDPAREADLMAAFYDMRAEAKAKVDEFRAPLDMLWGAMESGAPMGKVAYDTVSAIPREKQDAFLEALAMRAQTLPKEEQPAFWANFSKSLRGIGDFRQAAMEELAGAALEMDTRSFTPAGVGLTPGMAGGRSYQENEALRKEKGLDREFVRRVQEIEQGTYDPVQFLTDEDSKWRIFESAAYQVVPVTVNSLTMAIPYVGLPTMFAGMKGSAHNTLMQRFTAAGLATEDAIDAAETWSLPMAVVETALEKAQFGIWSRSLPGFSKGLDAIGDRIVNRALRGGMKALAIGGAETAVEMAQDFSGELIQDIAAGLDEDLPDVQWSGEGGVFDGAWAKAGETFLTMLPLSILGAAGGLSAESRNAAFRKADPLELRALGFSEKSIQEIADAPGPSSLASAITEGWESRDPNSPEAIAAVEQQKQRVEQARRAAAMLEGMAYTLPGITARPDGSFIVRDGMTGEEVGTAANLKELDAVVRAHSVAMESMQQDEMIQLVTWLNAAQVAAKDSGIQQELNLTRRFGMADVEAMGPEHTERFMAEVALQEQAEGGAGSASRAVFGMNLTETRNGIKQVVNKIFAGANIGMLFHENWHAARRKAKAAGSLTRADDIRLLRAFDKVMRGHTRKVKNADGSTLVPAIRKTFIPDGMADADLTEAMLDEAIAEIAEVMTFLFPRGHKTNKHGLTRKLVSTYLGTVGRLAPEATRKFSAFIRAIRAKMGLAMARAYDAKRAMAKGEFDQAELDSYLSKLLGTDQQQEHDDGVRAELNRILAMPDDVAEDDIPFSVGRVDRPFYSADNVQDLRHDKTAWLEDANARGKGNRDEADEIVSKYYKTAAYAGIPKDVILVPVPSTSGRNILPDALGARISKDFGQVLETRRVGTATAAGEAKNKRTFFDKEADPVNFVPNEPVIADLQGKRVFITEDVHNTGESWIAFARMLQENGVDVVGVATLVSTEQRITSPRDMERMSEKMAALLGKPLDEVLAAVHSLFDGTFKQLFNKAEAEISRANERSNASNARKIFDIASSGRRAGAYSNPLRNLGQSESGVSRPTLSQDTFQFSIGRSTVTPTPETREIQGSNGETVIGPAAFSIGAWHGTPHKVDKFTTEKIGTGEGAQAFGWGLYFADRMGVAKSYMTAGQRESLVGLLSLIQKESAYFVESKTWLGKKLTREESDAKLAKSFFKKYLKQFPDTKVTEELVLDVIKNGIANKTELAGNLYRVTLKVEPEDLLDWDKPLSEQSEKVQKGVREFVDERMLIDFRESDLAGPALSGALKGASARKASETLAAAGIRGIRFLDGNSRADGQGSYNYVIFSDADIEIVEENGTPVKMEEAGVSFSIGRAAGQAQGSAMPASMFEESNRLTNINPTGAMMAAIQRENPGFDPTATTVKVYRATIGEELRPNDFVALNRQIAIDHLESLKDRGETGKVKEFTVNTADLLMANDATEFVWYPVSPSFSIGRADVAERMQGGALAMVRDPIRRVQAMSRIARDFGDLFLSFQRIEALAGRRRSKAQLRQEANAREDMAADEKIGAVWAKYGGVMADGDLTKLKAQPVFNYLSVPRPDGSVDPLRGRLMSKAQAIKKNPERYALHKAGEYDGADGISRTVFGGTLMPDQAAQELFDAGLIAEPTPDAMWEALAREQRTVDTMKDFLAKAQEEIREARGEAKREASEWLATQGKEQETNYNPKEEILASLRMLDAILLALPPEIRGKIGGYTQMAQITTDEARLKFLKDRLKKADVELEQYLRETFTKEWLDLLARAKPDSDNPGMRPTGVIDADALDILRAAEAAMWLDFAKGEAEADRLDALAEHEDTKPHEADKLRVTAQMVRLTSNWSAADAARREQAVIEGTRIYYGGLAALRVKNSARAERLKDMRDSAKRGTGKAGSRMERKKMQRQERGSRAGQASRLVWEFLSFGQLVNVLFGEKSAAARWFNAKEIAASNAYEDGVQAKADAVESMLETLSGTRFGGEKLRHRMQTEERITTVDALGKQHTFTESEAITFLLMWQQEDGKRHMEGQMDEEGKLVSDWGWTQQNADEIEAGLSSEAKAMLAFFSSSYGEEYGRINDVFRRIWNVSMPRHKMYAPLTVKPSMGKQDAIVDPVSGDSMGVGMTPGSLKNRSQTAVTEPDFRDAFQVFLNHARQMEHFIAYAEFARDAMAITNRREMRNAIEAVSPTAAMALGKWVDYFALGGLREASAGGGWQQFFAGALSRLSSAALVGRISVLGMQALQLGAAAYKMPLGAFLSRFARLQMGRLSWAEAFNSPYIQRRMKEMPPIVRDAVMGLAAGTPNRAKYFAAMAGSTISGADGLFTAGTYAILYDYHLTQARKAGIPDPEKHAHAEAERLTDQVAQPVRTGARSWLEVSSQSQPAFRALWNFASDPRQKMALIVYDAMRHDLPAAEKAAAVGKAVAVTWAVSGILQAVVRAIFRDLRNDDDDELFDERHWDLKKLGLMAATGPLGGIPYLGGMLEASIYNAAGEWMPNNGILDALSQSVPAGMRLLTGDWDQVLKDTESVMTGGATLSGTSSATASAMHLIRDAVNIFENFDGD